MKTGVIRPFRLKSNAIGNLVFISWILNLIKLIAGIVLLVNGANERGSDAEMCIAIGIPLTVLSLFSLVFIPKLLNGFKEIVECAETINAYYRERFEVESINRI